MLTEAAIRTAQPAEKPQKLFDEDGLYLIVSPTGRRLWRQKYRYQGKEKLLGLGRWPDISLKRARERRDEIRRLLAEGLDPSVERREKSSGSLTITPIRTFENVAREWWAERKASERWDEGYAAQVLRQLERDVFSVSISRGLARRATAGAPSPQTFRWGMAFRFADAA
jgi:hypothetical protein